MQIVGVDSAVLGVEDMDAAQKFFLDTGFNVVERGRSGAMFECLDGTSVILRLSGDSALPPAVAPSPTARETIWGVKDAATLEKIGAELGKDRDVSLGSGGL